MVDLQPLSFEIENNLFPVGLEKSINLFVSIFVNGPEAEGPVRFDADVYLSQENHLNTVENKKVLLWFAKKDFLDTHNARQVKYKEVVSVFLYLMSPLTYSNITNLKIMRTHLNEGMQRI